MEDKIDSPSAFSKLLIGTRQEVSAPPCQRLMLVNHFAASTFNISQKLVCNLADSLTTLWLIDRSMETLPLRYVKCEHSPLVSLL